MRCGDFSSTQDDMHTNRMRCEFPESVGCVPSALRGPNGVLSGHVKRRSKDPLVRFPPIGRNSQADRRIRDSEMKAGIPTGRVGSLVIELATGTATVGDERIEIPRGEFELLAALAARPGETVSSKDLLQQLWPGDSVTTEQDLRSRVYRLRRRIGDHERDEKIVANRPGFGYLIDLPPSSVQVLKGAPDVADIGEPDVLYLDESSETAIESLTPVDVTSGPTSHHEARPMHQLEAPVEATRPSFRPRIVFMAAALAVTLLAASWVAGSWLSRLGRIDQSGLAQQGGDAPVTHPSTGSSKHGPQETKDPRRANGTNASRSHSDSAATTLAQSSDSTATDSSSAATEPGTNADGTKRDGATTIPAQPEARLFHLYNPDSGDHYMTTSSSTANKKQAAGYQASTEGRVFSEQEKGTVAITLDGGTAFVYRDSGSAPQGIDVTVLYRLTKDGDYFYAASASEANEAQASGWSLATVGYVAE